MPQLKEQGGLHTHGNVNQLLSANQVLDSSACVNKAVIPLIAVLILSSWFNTLPKKTKNLYAYISSRMKQQIQKSWHVKLNTTT